jgi:hypothetical protein
MPISKTQIIKAIEALPQEEVADIGEVAEEIILIKKMKKD